jgi:hypothetical protein
MKMPKKHRLLSFLFITFTVSGAGIGAVLAADNARATDPATATQAVDARIANGTGETYGPDATVFSDATDSLAASISTSSATRCVNLDNNAAACFPAASAGGISARLPDGRVVVAGYTPSLAQRATAEWQQYSASAVVRNHYYVIAMSIPLQRDANGWPIPARPIVNFSN